MPFPRVLVICEMYSVSSRIWTRVAVSISNDDDYYTSFCRISSVSFLCVCVCVCVWNHFYRNHLVLKIITSNFFSLVSYTLMKFLSETLQCLRIIRAFDFITSKNISVRQFSATYVKRLESYLILWGRLDFHMVVNVLIAVHACFLHILTSLSVDEILLPKYVKLCINFRGLLFNEISHFV